jgi:hypothetical protein
MKQQTGSLVRALLYGLTGAGLFRRLDYPGAPEEFIDSRTLAEIKASGEFDRTCRAYMGAKYDKQRDDARRGRKAAQEADAARAR